MANTPKTNRMSSSDYFEFSALRGIQAGREYYTIMCPLKLIPTIFVFNEPGISPQLRAQRVLNKARIPEMVSYLVNNRRDYVFSSITASIDGDVKFEPLESEGPSSKIGKLSISVNAKFLINDGQHRRKAIEEALKQRPDLSAETISVVFYLDSGLKHSQQMFSDLNKHAIRPTKSLNILYDHRDIFSHSILGMLSEVPIFNEITELERTSISNRAHKVFTLNSIYSASKALLGKTEKKPKLTNDEEKLIMTYWNEVYNNISEWQEIVNNTLQPYDARKNFVHVHGILLHALGILGNDLMKRYPQKWKSKLKQLNEIDWSKDNREWEGRSMIGGRLTKVSANIVLTSNLLKSKLGLSLNQNEENLEKRFLRK
ncbi:DNA sulfur modification protein DndB [Candidatus Woesearchaeota archaeon]|nr:MAG: DNA sulfur modification protein DndB [Candidatus Woesearchaeota archaeon]